MASCGVCRKQYALIYITGPVESLALFKARLQKRYQADGIAFHAGTENNLCTAVGMCITTDVFCSVLAQFPDISTRVRGHNNKTEVSKFLKWIDPYIDTSKQTNQFAVGYQQQDQFVYGFPDVFTNTGIPKEVRKCSGFEHYTLYPGLKSYLDANASDDWTAGITWKKSSFWNDPGRFCILKYQIYNTLVHQYKNSSKFESTQITTAISLNNKINEMDRKMNVFRRHIKTLGGYRIEFKVRVRSLRQFINDYDEELYFSTEMLFIKSKIRENMLSLGDNREFVD
jgi:hypothetical protein